MEKDTVKNGAKVITQNEEKSKTEPALVEGGGREPEATYKPNSVISRMLARQINMLYGYYRMEK